MAKFGNPLGQGTELFITQTYHTTAGNTAIDISSLANKPVYAIADGKILHTDTKLGSYCTTSITNSSLGSLFYVHTYKWLPVGTAFKKGDKICEIAPTSLNGNNPTHLHLGLPTGNHIMDYMDRSIVFKAGFTWGSKQNLEIRNAWFNGGSELNWSLFKDLSYNDNVMEYKKGDVIIFTEKQNKRGGAGTGFADMGAYEVGEIATIKDNPRGSQNSQFYGKGSDTKINDTYTWFDTVSSSGQSFWVANMGKFRLATPEEISPPKPPQEPTTPPALVECQNKVKDLESDIVAKNKQISTLTKNLEKSNEKVVKLEGELKLEKDKIRVEQERVAHLEGVLKGEREEANEIAIKMEKMIEDYKELEQEKLDLKEQLSKGTLAKASTGEIFAELWNRIIRSIK